MSDGSAKRVSALFDSYREKYPVREPNLLRKRNDDELRRLTPEDGLAYLNFPPINLAVLGKPPFEDGADHNGLNKYLWVVARQELPYILEEGPAGKALTRKSVSHTNLTGGDAAHCGGELWFRNHEAFWLSGGSSRYAPRSEIELESIAGCFRACGFDVVSFGWDHGIGGPARFQRGKS